MLNRYEEASACTIVTFLAQCVVTGLEIWLRGLATNIICSSGDLRRKAGC